MKIKKEYVEQFLNFLNYDNYYFQTFKPRINGEYQSGVIAQEFCNKERVITLCEKLNGRGVICVALNYRPEGLTKKEDIKRLRVIAIDIDVKGERKLEYVSTDEDYKHAQEVADKIKQYLEKEYGFIIQLVIKSGNGAQVLAKCDVPIEDLELLQLKLTELENKIKTLFEDKIVDIDAITKDINRRLKIAGTINKKDTHQRINRFSEIIYHKEITPEDVSINSKIIISFKEKIRSLTNIVNEIEQKEVVDDMLGLLNVVKRDEKLHDLLTLNVEQLNKKYFTDDGKPKYKSESEVDMAVSVKLCFYNASDKLIDIALTQKKGSWSGKNQSYRDLTIKKARSFNQKKTIDSPRTYTNNKKIIINNIIYSVSVFVDKKILKTFQTAKKLNLDFKFNLDENIFQGLYIDESFNHTYFLNEKVPPSKIKELVSELYSKTGKFPFFITPQKTVEGRNIGAISQNKELMSVVRLIRIEKKDEVTEKVLLLNDSFPKGAEVVKSIELPFFVYDFIGSDRVKYVLLSLDELPVGPIRLKANLYSLSDRVDVTKNLKISTNQKVLMISDAEPLINNWTPSHFNDFTKVGYPSIMSHVFNVYREPVSYEWAEDLTMASLVGSAFNGYPIHLCKLGFEGCFKSKWLNWMHSSLEEPQPITSGEASRLKGIIPSYKSSPPDAGAFLKAKWFCGVDEFFKIIARETTMGDVGRAVSGLNALNSLMEWQVRLFSSGTGSILKSKPTSRFFCTSNFVDLDPSISESNGYCLNDCFRDEFMSFVSRMLFFCVTRAHKEALVGVIKTTDDELPSVIKSLDWVNCYEFMIRSPVKFSSDVKVKVRGLHAEVKARVFSDDRYPLLKRYFCNMRMINGFHRLLDGLVKVRCLKTGVWDLEVSDADLKHFKFIILNVVRSWFDFNGYNEATAIIKSLMKGD